jgi:hypothetical protein
MDKMEPLLLSTTRSARFIQRLAESIKALPGAADERLEAF